MRKKGQMRGGRKQEDRNKAGYTAQDAPSTLLKITRDGRTDGRTRPLIEMEKKMAVEIASKEKYEVGESRNIHEREVHFRASD